MPPKLLITGFGPFPGAALNPAGLVARRVAQVLRRRGMVADTLVLHTSYGFGLTALAQALEPAAPDAVLMIGLASRDLQVRVEKMARPGASATLHDANGQSPAAGMGAKAPLPTTGRPVPALAQLRRHGLSARLSMSAGRYLCNAAYGVALSWAHRRTAAPPVLFIHIPRLVPRAGTLPMARRRSTPPHPRPLTMALAAIAADLARQALWQRPQR